MFFAIDNGKFYLEVSKSKCPILVWDHPFHPLEKYLYWLICTNVTLAQILERNQFFYWYYKLFTIEATKANQSIVSYGYFIDNEHNFHTIFFTVNSTVIENNKDTNNYLVDTKKTVKFNLLTSVATMGIVMARDRQWTDL